MPKSAVKRKPWHRAKFNSESLAKVVQWANANPVEYGEDVKCAFEKAKDASFVEESEGKGEKYEWFHFDVPQYEVHQSGPNKGKYKCKCRGKELIPAYMFRKDFRAVWSG